jgi:hypothetical protein
MGVRDHAAVAGYLALDESETFSLMEDVLKSQRSRESALELPLYDAERFMLLLQSVSPQCVFFVPEAHNCGREDVG